MTFPSQRTSSKEPEILYEDNHIIVCKKPAGIATQSKRIGSPDMVSLLKNHLAKASTVSGEPYLAVIHRLDQPVSGILVFAKTKKAAAELNRQLNGQGFGKYYRALVCKPPKKQASDLENYLVKDAKTNTSRVCKKDTPGAKLAKLHYQVVCTPPFLFEADALDESTELDIHLDTGRHHQIRVQLAHLGCPIAGDTKYNPAAKETAGWQKLALCAYRLSFRHPVTGKLMEFSLL